MLISVGAVSACDRPMSRLANGLPLPMQTFDHIARLPVNVGDVRVFSSDQIGEMPKGFVVSVHDRAVLYLSQKFDVLDASSHSLRIVIEDASVEKSEQKSSYSLFSMVGVDGLHLYDVRLSLRLEHRDDYGRVVHAESVMASKRFSISEHDGPAAREQKQFSAIEELFAVLDPQMERVVKLKMRL